MRASEKKAKKNYKQKVDHLRFDIYLNDTDIKEWLDKQISKQGAIKMLIREEIEREKTYTDEDSFIENKLMKIKKPKRIRHEEQVDTTYKRILTLMDETDY